MITFPFTIYLRSDKFLLYAYTYEVISNYRMLKIRIKFAFSSSICSYVVIDILAKFSMFFPFFLPSVLKMALIWQLDIKE